MDKQQRKHNEMNMDAPESTLEEHNPEQEAKNLPEEQATPSAGQQRKKKQPAQKPTNKNSNEQMDFSKLKEKLQQTQSAPTIAISGKTHVGTGIDGIDQLFAKGIPRGSTTLVVGGPGSGKTIFCLQTLYEAAKAGEKVLYMTLEEDTERLRQHMKDFGWDITPLEKRGFFVIKKFNPMDITRQMDAMLEQVRGELLIDLKPLLIPKDFEPDRVALDSLSAVAAALFEKEESYRLYLEQLFKLFNDIGSTAFLISETPDPTQKLSATGTEEFLADGVFIFYNVRTGNSRESAFEILKMRGASFKKQIVAMQIKENGIVVYPEQEVFTTI